MPDERCAAGGGSPRSAGTSRGPMRPVTGRSASPDANREGPGRRYVPVSRVSPSPSRHPGPSPSSSWPTVTVKLGWTWAASHAAVTVPRTVGAAAGAAKTLYFRAFCRDRATENVLVTCVVQDFQVARRSGSARDSNTSNFQPLKIQPFITACLAPARGVQ